MSTFTPRTYTPLQRFSATIPPPPLPEVNKAAKDSERLKNKSMHDLLKIEGKGRERHIPDDYNFWATYRKGTHRWLSDDEVIHNWRTQNAPPTGHDLQAQAYINPRVPLGRIGQENAFPLHQQPKLPHQQDFMNRNPPELGGYQGLWRGVRLLRDNRTASVGLWTYTGDVTQTNFRVDKLVVKEAKVENGSLVDLRSEAHMLRYLQHSKSQHINLHFGRARLSGEDPLVNSPEDVGKVGRIFLEYCQMGDLNALINYRRWSQKPFDEITLWKLFECLVDGFTTLETGNEAIINPETSSPDYPAERRIFDRDRNDISLPNDKNPWKEVIHFDVKSGNMLLDRDEAHTETPIVKIGDFGSAKYLDEVTPENYLDDDSRAAERKRGTNGHHHPEQFTEHWDYRDWASTGIAGNYCTKTNVWGIGNIMHEALTLRTFKLPIGRPFKPAFLIFGQPSLGLTYDETLTRYTEYSQKLRNTIWSCLYEKPVHRLTLYELKCHVVRGKRMALAAAEQAIKEFPRNQAEAAGKLAKDRAEILASYQRDLAIFRRDRAVYGDAEPTLVVIPDPPPLKMPRTHEPWEDFEVPLGPEIQVDSHPFGRPDSQNRLIPRGNGHGFLLYDPYHKVLYDPPVSPFIPKPGHLLYYPGNTLYSLEKGSFEDALPYNLLDVAEYKPKPTTSSSNNPYYTGEYYTPDLGGPLQPGPVPAPPSLHSSILSSDNSQQYQGYLAQQAQLGLLGGPGHFKPTVGLGMHMQQNEGGPVVQQPPDFGQQPDMRFLHQYLPPDQHRQDMVMDYHGTEPQTMQPPFENYDPSMYMPVQQNIQPIPHAAYGTTYYPTNAAFPYDPYHPPNQPQLLQPAHKRNRRPRKKNKHPHLNQDSQAGSGMGASHPPDRKSPNKQRRGPSGNPGIARGPHQSPTSTETIQKQRNPINKGYNTAASPPRPTFTPQTFPTLGAPEEVISRKTSGKSDADRLNGNMSGSNGSDENGARRSGGRSGGKGKKVVYKPWDGR